MKLFIHGVPDTGYMWTTLVQALGLAEGEYRTPTMPGFDGTTPQGFAATMHDYLGWVVKTLESTAEAHGKVDIVGHDWGAPLCAMAAQMNPELIRSWTVINAVPEPTYKWHATARTWQTPILGELFMLFANQKKLHDNLTAAGMPLEVARHEVPQIDRHMKRAILRLYRSAKDPSKWNIDFSNIASRGLVMWGADDPFVPVKYARNFCGRWDIPLIEIPGTGHWGLCENPEDFATNLKKHWDTKPDG